MQAIILNSGIGKRLLSLTSVKPKCLLEIKGKKILEYQLEALTENNIENILITTGPFENQIKDFVSQRFPNLNITYVNNPKYDTTNYIYSIWLAKNQIVDTVILLHGDLVFDKDLAKKLIESKEDNYVLVNKLITPPEKDFKALLKLGYVSKIAVDLEGENVFFLAPFYKIYQNDFQKWLLKISNYVEHDKTTLYAEDALNEILNDVILKPLFYEDEVCKEIDTYEDIVLLEKLLLKNSLH